MPQVARPIGYFIRHPAKKTESGRVRPNIGTKHARPLELCMKGLKKSALQVDRYRFSKLKLERRLRAKLDVFLSCQQLSRGSGS